MILFHHYDTVRPTPLNAVTVLDVHFQGCGRLATITQCCSGQGIHGWVCAVITERREFTQGHVPPAPFPRSDLQV